MSTTIAHISDLHFGAEDPAVVVGLAADIGRAPPDLVVVSGDLTQRARHAEYAAAARFLAALPAPVLAVPGNHDVTPYNLIERFTDPWRRWRAHMAADTAPDWQDGHVLVMGLNTARRGGLYLNWARGGASDGRLRALARRAAAAPPGLFRIVVAHHPFAAPALAPAARLAGNAGAALACFTRLGVRMVLTGHLHLPETAATTACGIRLVQAPTATSHRLRGAPNAYHRITVAEGAAHITTRVWTGVAWADATPTPPAA